MTTMTTERPSTPRTWTFEETVVSLMGLPLETLRDLHASCKRLVDVPNPTPQAHFNLNSVIEAGKRVAAAQAAQATYDVTDTPAAQPAVRVRTTTGSVSDRCARAEAALPNHSKLSYAITIDGTTKFYQVDKPQKGKWAGFTFVSVQASDETYRIKNMGERIRILEAIAQDPQLAMERYGKELGECGHCHRTLTNEESRARGIGPVCASKMGW